MRLVLVSIILVSSANKTGWDFNFLQLEKVLQLRHVLYIITLIPILNVGFR